ncbi:hypothetical protein N0V88_002728 [Collariella sp. IMI 366227]|nr:hypothetical protein N0V88_002728 [Collariella sp. IMI 366227]
MAAQTNSPIALKRLEQIAADVCNSVFESVEFYEHPKTAQWNETIIVQGYKFAINSTIVQHVVPTSQLNKPASPSAEESAAAAKKGQSGRRGMHSATGGFWNEKTDGMWSFKWDGEGKGLDVVLMLIWIAV